MSGRSDDDGERSDGTALKNVLEDRDVEPSWIALSLACVNTGLIGSICFLPTKSWVGFMTGNTIQLGMLVSGPRSFDNTDAAKITALGSFALGCFAVSRIADRYGKTTRWWAVSSFVFQAVLSLIAASILAAVEAKKRDAFDAPVAHIALGLLALSMGWQALVCSAFESPFSSTVVLTMVTLSLFADPKLFNLQNSARNARIIAILSAAVGGALSSAILRVQTPAIGLVVAAGLQLLVALAWSLAKPKRRIEI